MKPQKYALKEHEHNTTFILIIWTVACICLVSIFFGGLIIYQKFQEIESQLPQEEECDLIHTIYHLEDGVHQTWYFPCNHSYTIDVPFTCDGYTHYTNYDSYLQECLEDLE